MVITNEQVKQLSSMLADAFADTPTFYYIMKNDHDFRIKNLKYLFACNIKIMLNKSKESLYMNSIITASQYPFTCLSYQISRQCLYLR